MEEQLKNGGKVIMDAINGKMKRNVVKVIEDVVDSNVSDITTSIGSYVVRSVRNRFQRSVTITVGMHYNDDWMEEAIHAIFYKYNDIKKSSNLEIAPINKTTRSETYIRIGDGVHTLNYRNYKVMLVVQSNAAGTARFGPPTQQRIYTVITYNLDTKFVDSFNNDMMKCRDDILMIKKSSPNVTIYADSTSDGSYVCWDEIMPIPKRPIRTVYIDKSKEKLLIGSLNNYIASKELYDSSGIAHNFKILLYGPPGTGKDTIAKMIASEYNRNIYYVRGGANGHYIPEAITSFNNSVVSPLYIVSDMDKYPFLINECPIDVSKANSSHTPDSIKHKQLFGNMINALDGFMSGSGKIIVMTTNNIELFSETLCRPGRIDLIMEIGYTNLDTFRRYMRDMYKQDVPTNRVLNNDELTMSKLQLDVIIKKKSFEEIVEKYTCLPSEKKVKVEKPAVKKSKKSESSPAEDINANK